MTVSNKFYVRIDSDDAETSALQALTNVLKASGLTPWTQCRVLRYLLARAEHAMSTTAPTTPPTE